MSLIQNIAIRLLSSGKIFRVPEGARSGAIYDILRRAEAVFGSVVIFEPGSFEMPDLFEFSNIAVIGAYQPTVTTLNRYGNGILKGVQRYAHTDIRLDIGGFTIHDKVETSTPALEFGGSQGGYVHDIFTEGPAADLIQLTNAEPAPPFEVPIGHAHGTWTENWTIERIMISSANAGAIRTRVLDGQRRFQSFANLHLKNVQVGLLKPGAVALDVGDHSNIYCSHIGIKANIERAAIPDKMGEMPSPLGPAICINVQSHAFLHGFFDSFVEGDAIRDPVTGAVITRAGLRIKVDPTARVSGHGKFYAQDSAATPDLLIPGTTWKGTPGGCVDNDILADQA